MLILHSSNKTENLLEHLITVLEKSPLSHPLVGETFLLQSIGMERWLQQRLADRFGVWANARFLFPNKLFGEFANKIDADIDASFFDRDLMLWRFELLLRTINPTKYPLLAQYLSGDNIELKRYQLARQLAQVFDQYQLMRPDMLTLWQDNKLLYGTASERWQRALWQELTANNNKHRGAVRQTINDKLKQAAAGSYTELLPERIFVFGLNTMPPLFLDYLQGLARHCDIHLFLLNPAQDYWADLQRKKHPTADSSGHPLLGKFGQQGREFQQMLLEQAEFDYEPSSYQTHQTSSNLQQLQNDILLNGSGKPLQYDGTISIHSCHSPMREVEVLKDQLLQCLEENGDMQLGDIVIMAPDIQRYAPFIAAVFADLPHAIADRSEHTSNGVLAAFIQFIEVSQSRFGWQQVLDLLELPPVAARFAISASDFATIKHWVQDTNIRWGKSAEHRQQLGLPSEAQNTWRAGLHRLLMGYASNSEDFVAGVLPYPNIEGMQAQILGRFCDFMQLLCRASEDFTAMPLAKWLQVLSHYAGKLLLANNDVERGQYQQLAQLLEQLTAASPYHQQPVTLKVVLAQLINTATAKQSASGFLRGQLTFCSLLPMRAIPFKVIALLGINDGEFPKIDSYPSFDLVGQNFRQGDRSARTDSRYQFLQVLLSARQQLIITYLGQSPQHNSKIPPSVVISELVEVLENHYQLGLSCCHHPLQPFSHRYFTGDSALFSFSGEFCRTATMLQTKRLAAFCWQGEAKMAKPTAIDVADLFAFFAQPQRYFLRQFGIRFAEIAQDTKEREPFAVDTLSQYNTNQRWVGKELAGESLSLATLQAQGLWPSGAAGALIHQQRQLRISEFAAAIAGLNLGDACCNIQIDCTIGGYKLFGTVGNIFAKGNLLWRCTKFKSKDFVQAWLHHLLCNQQGSTDTYLLADDRRLFFASDLATSEHLAQLVEFFVLGRRRPNAFFTQAVMEYMQAKDPDVGYKKAQKLLAREIDYCPALHYLYQHADWDEVLDKNFLAYCQNSLPAVWQAATRAAKVQ